MKKDNLKQLLANNKIEISEHQLEQLITFRNLVIDSNKKFNLTSITEIDAFNVKHFLDSLIISNYFSGFAPNEKVIDIGSGGGFPGIPLAIYFPKTEFTLVDSTAKKTFFLHEVVQTLNLKNVKIINNRAELLDEIFFGFDYALSRGFAPLAINLEILAPFLKPKGKIILFKTPKETNAFAFSSLQKIFKKINLTFLREETFLLDGDYERSFLFFEQIASKKAKKQREYKEIKKNPLF